MLANADISYGSTATTYGKIYAGIDSSGTKHNIDHQGTAYGNLYAEGTITGSPTMAGTPQAQKYTGAAGTIRAVIKQPINFSNFTTSLTDIKRAADLNLVGGQKVYDLNNTNYDVWKLTFNSNGTVAVAGCKDSGSNAPEYSAPYIASKFAVLALTECLAHDLQAQGAPIGVSVLVPGIVDTKIAYSTRTGPTSRPATRRRRTPTSSSRRCGT